LQHLWAPIMIQLQERFLNQIADLFSIIVCGPSYLLLKRACKDEDSWTDSEKKDLLLYVCNTFMPQIKVLPRLHYICSQLAQL